MAYLERLLQRKQDLKLEYRQLIEQAYNLRQTDHALSDISEFKATMVLNEINKLKFIIRDTSLSPN